MPNNYVFFFVSDKFFWFESAPDFFKSLHHVAFAGHSHYSHYAVVNYHLLDHHYLISRQTIILLKENQHWQTNGLSKSLCFLPREYPVLCFWGRSPKPKFSKILAWTSFVRILFAFQILNCVWFSFLIDG